ncbi:MAG: YXWGXW repeat-containing protein [Burkholderiaceae bacterium]
MRVPRPSSSLVNATAIALLALGLSGCVVVPARPAYGYGYGGPVAAEGYGAPPVAGYIWINGFWDWHSGRRNWVEGHWGPPRHGR